MGDSASGESGDGDGEKGIELMNIRYVILSICILILFACAPTKVENRDHQSHGGEWDRRGKKSKR